MKPYALDGVPFSAYNVAPFFPFGTTGPDGTPVVTEQIDGTGFVGGVSRGARALTMVVDPLPPPTVDKTDVETTLLAFLGAVDPDDASPRVLQAKMDVDGDGFSETVVEAEARIVSWQWADASGKRLVLTFATKDATWRGLVAEDDSVTVSSSPSSLTHTNVGMAPVSPVYQLFWTVQRATSTATLGWTKRRRFTLQNTLGRSIPPFAYRIDLGDTSALVAAGKARSDGQDVRVLLGGEDLTRHLVGWPFTKSYCWFVVPGMDVGETLTFDLIYGNPNGAPAPVWTDNDNRRPVFDHKWERDTATGGSTTTLVRTGAGWEANEWKWATLYIAGENHLVQSNTSDTLTVVSTGHTIASPEQYLLSHGSNDRWVYAVRQTNRKGNYRRGRWWLSSDRVTPSGIGFDSPGSWHPQLTLDNRDSMGQYRVIMPIVDGGSDHDPFSDLYAARTWEGNDSKVPNPGTADGVAITTPWPVTGVDHEYTIYAPNAICKAVTLVRASGAEDWANAWEDAAVANSPATRSISALDLTGYGSVYQLAQALWPRNEIEIGPDWKRVDGSLTAGTTTTATDPALALVTDQFNGGRFRAVSGDNAGKTRSITGNTGTVFTINAMPKAMADGDRYRATNPLLIATYQDAGYLKLDLDSSGIVYSGLGTETEVYDLSATVYIGAGPPGADPTGQHRVLTGIGAGGKRLLLSADERIEIDAGRRLIRWVTEELAATTATGGDADSINKTGAGWTVDAFEDMALRVFTGNAVGVYKIRSNSSSRIDIYGTFPNVPANGDSFEVYSYGDAIADPAVIVQYHDGESWKRSASWLPVGVGDQTIFVSEANIGTIRLSLIYSPAYLG